MKLYRTAILENIWRLFHVLTQLPFTISETELDYHHHRVSLQVTSRGVERLKTGNLKISRKILKCFELSKYLADKKQPLNISQKNLFLLNFDNFLQCFVQDCNLLCSHGAI